MSPKMGLEAHSARVYNNANISVANAAWQTLTFNSERWDTSGMHSIVANTSRLTAPIAGQYLVVAQVEIAQHATGRRILNICQDGDYTNFMAFEERGNLGVSIATVLLAVTLVNLAAGGYVECQVYQNSGGALNVLYTANRSPEFSMALITPA